MKRLKVQKLPQVLETHKCIIHPYLKCIDLRIAKYWNIFCSKQKDWYGTHVLHNTVLAAKEMVRTVYSPHHKYVLSMSATLFYSNWMSSRGTQLREPFTINLHAILTMLYANLFKLTMGRICELYEQTAMLH